jgi:hypothetical protein
MMTQGKVIKRKKKIAYMSARFDCLWKNYKTISEQILALDLDRNQAQNIMQLIAYERQVLIAADSIEEIIKSYPNEADCGMYIVVVNGKIVIVNNRQEIIKHLQKNEFYYLDKTILVHQLGKTLDFELFNALNSQPNQFWIKQLQ